MGKLKILMPILALVLTSLVQAQDKVDGVVNAGVERNKESAASQKRVDTIATSTDKLVAQYKKELKVIDGLKVYNALLQRQLELQTLEMQQLRTSIEEVSVIERQITPLMLRMVESLEQFVMLDMPFLLEERTERVARLKDTIGRADVTAAEKFRNVLEAFQIENDYGRTIEAYKDVIDGIEVSLLRFGRVSLVYQDESGTINKAWDQEAGQWVELDSAEYRNHIARGLKIARKQVAPDLIMLPVSAAGGAQ
ncbi:MAG: DUF3450 domain-containing protein [Gammaproteobacteria bacterium]